MAETDTSPNFLERMKSYVRTRKGSILAAEILVSLIILICYAASLYGGYSSVPICEMIFSIIFFVIFMMEIDKQLQFVSWIWTDLIRAGIGAVLYLIIGLITVIGGTGDGARIAGGVFSLIAGILFGYDAYTVFLEVKSTRGRSAAPTSEA